MERTHSGGPWTARAHTWTPSGRSSRGFLTPTWGHHTASLADPVRWIEDPPTPVPRMDSNDPGQPVKMCRRRRRPRHGLHTHAHRGPSPLAPAPGPFATGLCSDGRGQAAQPSCLPRSPHLLVRFPKAPHSQQPRGLTSQLLPPSRASREETPPPSTDFRPRGACLREKLSATAAAGRGPTDVSVSRTRAHHSPSAGPAELTINHLSAERA